MMNAKLIGIGAAGNKAAIAAIEKGIISRESVVLLNSTLKDVPANYKNIAIQIGDAGGCAKERSLAKELTFNAIENGKLVLDNVLDPTDKMVIIVSSSEGGTGCGASSMVAQYFHVAIPKESKKPVHMFVFTGFEEDGRGLKNTVEYFQDLEEDYTVQAISNKKFLKEAGNNKIKAEDLANDEFCQRIKVLLGQVIIDSDNNIDERDLEKLITTPGFMTIEYGELSKIKNIDIFNKTVSDIIDNTKSLDVEPSVKRIGVIFNVSSKTKDNIDYFHTVIKEKLGVPYESFTHVQSEDEPEFIAIIAAGMKIPIDEINTIFEKYQEESNKVNKSRDAFFTKSSFDFTDEDSIFDMGKGNKKEDVSENGKRNFFNKFKPNSNPQTPKETASKFANTKKAEEVESKF